MDTLHFVTFGQVHSHIIDGATYDKDCVAVFTAENGDGRQKAFDLFGPRFCFEYPQHAWDPEVMKYFSDGYKAMDKRAKELLNENYYV